MDHIDENRVEYDEETGYVKPVSLQPDWKNAPTVAKLKNDVRDAEPTFNAHVRNVPVSPIFHSINFLTS